MPNNRQIAVVIWLLVLVAWVLLYPKTRRSLPQVLRAAAHMVIVVPIVGMIFLTAGLVYAGFVVHLWAPDLVTDTIFWFFSAGMVLFGRFGRVTTQRDFVRKTARALFRVTLLVGVFVELFVLSIFWEVLLQPVVALLAILSVVAAQRPEHRPVKSLADGLMGILGLGLLLYVVVHLVDNWRAIDGIGVTRQLVLPVWLTIGTLPYIYGLGLFAAYQTAFVRIDFKSRRSWRSRARSKLALLLLIGPRAEELGRFNGAWQFKIAETSTYRSARGVVREFRHAERRRVAEETAVAARLARFAGSDETDNGGHRLDQREFDTTKAALRWLATCQMGWHRKPDGRYRGDLLVMLAGTWTSMGLPEPPGIVLTVSDSGQAWYAWRRTISGWTFAIGADSPPPDQWTYDGPSPPLGPPGSDACWGPSSVASDASPNW